MRCPSCNITVLGTAWVHDDGTVIHKECLRKYEALNSGRLYRCPVCNTKGTVDNKNKPIAQRVKDPNPNYVPSCAFNGCWGCITCREGELTVVGYEQKLCKLCEGHGWTKTEAKPVTEVVDWKL